jgi:hypothetical protein
VRVALGSAANRARLVDLRTGRSVHADDREQAAADATAAQLLSGGLGQPIDPFDPDRARRELQGRWAARGVSVYVRTGLDETYRFREWGLGLRRTALLWYPTRDRDGRNAVVDGARMLEEFAEVAQGYAAMHRTIAESTRGGRRQLAQIERYRAAGITSMQVRDVAWARRLGAWLLPRVPAEVAADVQKLVDAGDRAALMTLMTAGLAESHGDAFLTRFAERHGFEWGPARRATGDRFGEEQPAAVYHQDRTGDRWRTVRRYRVHRAAADAGRAVARAP